MAAAARALGMHRLTLYRLLTRVKSLRRQSFYPEGEKPPSPSMACLKYWICTQDDLLAADSNDGHIPTGLSLQLYPDGSGTVIVTCVLSSRIAIRQANGL